MADSRRAIGGVLKRSMKIGLGLGGALLLPQCMGATSTDTGDRGGEEVATDHQPLLVNNGGAVFSIVARHSGKCLDLNGGSSADGANIQQWTCNGLSPQAWRLQTLNDGYFYLVNGASGKVADVWGWGTADGSNVNQWTNTGGANQQFQFVPTTDGWFKIVNRNSGKPIEVAAGGTGDGANVDISTANGQQYQEWRIQPLDGKVINRNNGKTLQVNGATGSILATYGNTSAQHWTWAPTDNGYYTITSQSTGQVLEVSGCVTGDGGAVGVYTWLNNPCQQWRITPTTDGYFQLTNRNSGKTLDAAGCGTGMDQWGWLNNDCQKFRFEAPGYDWVPSTDTLVHDPQVIKQGSTYYMGTTGGLITLKKSTDRIAWQDTGTVFASMPSWIATQLGQSVTDLWAPDIAYMGGKYYLYYVGSLFGTNKSVIGVASNPTLDNTSPSYLWTDLGKVISTTTTDNYNAIDPNIAFDAGGVPWMSFGSFWSGIKMRRIDPNTGKLSTGNPTLYSLASRGGGAIEAPSVLTANGYYYLFVSYDNCCGGADSTYRTMVGRSTAITGPYKDSAGNLMSSGYAKQMLTGIDHWRGPGGGSVFMDGTTPYFANHYYDSLDYGNSKLQIRQITFDGSNWPIMGAPIP